MILAVEKSKLSGKVQIPGSKSHTIRAVAIGSMSSGTSHIKSPLVSSDTLSAVEVYRGFGASISLGAEWIIEGYGSKPKTPDDVLNVGNSGTTLYIAMGSAALADGYTVFTGDHQTRNRPAGPLLEALSNLGVQCFSTRGNEKPPLVIRGPMRGGHTSLDGSKTSQYVTSLLLNCPLAPADTEILLRNAVEHPYIEMTLGWLDEQGIQYERDGFERFKITGGQCYRAFEKTIPGDFSSATFFMCAAAVTESDLTLLGLDMNDSQGDKAVIEMLEEMGVKIEQIEGGIRIRGGNLEGREFDLQATPDALPAMAVVSCFAKGTTKLLNVPQARLKETDRIRVMREELSKMGGKVEELPDGLIITGSGLKATRVSGHGDHRVVMALAVAGLACNGRTEIETAEAIKVTFPNFVELMKEVGANIWMLEEQSDNNAGITIER